jgi:hypothetical protein
VATDKPIETAIRALVEILVFAAANAREISRIPSITANVTTPTKIIG